MKDLEPNLERLLGRRPKVVIGHPIIARGGSESIVMWLIEALKQDCHVTVVTTAGWDLDDLNLFYGTSVKPDEVSVRIAPVPLLPHTLMAAALRGAWFQRFAQRIAGEYDVRIGAYGPVNWGVPAIHFVADFSWHPPLRKALDPPSTGFIYKNTALRRMYLKLAGACAGRSECVSERGLMIANSEWTAKMLQKHCNVEFAPVVYPPVWTVFPLVSWSEKESSFVMIGRIAAEKRIEEGIAILRAIRECGHRIKLHLCGRIGRDAYGGMIERLCNENKDWIVAEGEVSGDRKARLLAQSKFGIQTRTAEPFGISVAEMVKAGAIVFAPSGCGSAEVLDHPLLTFQSDADAAGKIDAVLRDESTQQVLRDHLRRRGDRFAPEDFVRESRRAIADFLAVRSECAPSLT